MSTISRSLAALTAALFATSLVGCVVSAPKYPSRWGGTDPSPGWSSIRPAKNEDVCLLTGAFADAGEPAPGYEEREPPSLWKILNRVFPDRVPAAPGSVKEVRFDGPRNGQLVISGWNEGTQVLSATIIRATKGTLQGNYECAENGSVTFAYSQGGEFATVAFDEAKDVLLARGAEGCLIVRANRFDFGTAMLILFGAKFERRWYRFPPVPKSLPSGDRPETHQPDADAAHGGAVRQPTSL